MQSLLKESFLIAILEKKWFLPIITLVMDICTLICITEGSE